MAEDVSKLNLLSRFEMHRHKQEAFYLELPTGVGPDTPMECILLI